MVDGEEGTEDEEGAKPKSLMDDGRQGLGEGWAWSDISWSGGVRNPLRVWLFNGVNGLEKAMFELWSKLARTDEQHEVESSHQGEEDSEV